MNVKISVDSASLERAREKLSPARVDAASRTAINRALGNLNKELTKRLGQRIALKASVIKGHIKDRPARGRALEASLTVDFRPVALREYPHSVSRRRGISVTTLKSDGRQRQSRRVFINTAFGNHIFERVKGAPKRLVESPKGRGTNRGRKKQPISKMHGTSVRAQAAPIVTELIESGWLAERVAFQLESRITAALNPKSAKFMPSAGGES